MNRVWLVLIGILAGLLVTEVVVLYGQITSPASNATGWYIGMDYDFYRGVGARWLETGEYYRPYQLAGPYDVRLMSDTLYPPTALMLFVPLVWLPAVVWWAVPITIVGYALYRWRPARWAWAVMLLILMVPRSLGVFFHGNTDLWVAAGVAGGLLWGWPAALVALKPIFAPLALLGIRRRAWWVAAGLGLASVAVMAPLWVDYVVAMRNLRIPWDYSLTSVPLVLLPLVAYVGQSNAGNVFALFQMRMKSYAPWDRGWEPPA